MTSPEITTTDRVAVATRVPVWTRPIRWWRSFGRPPRHMGLDVARGVAILGMVGAHVGGVGDLRLDDPATWTGIVHGNPSILFAVLAGVSIALMTGRMTPPAVEDLPRLRLSLIGRGAVIFLIGLLLELLNTPVAVILTMYGLLYFVAIPFLRWRPRNLLILAGVMAVVAPPLMSGVQALAMMPTGPGLTLTLYGMYPITAWATLMFAGMALGRMSLSSARTAVGCIIAGGAAVLVGLLLGAWGQAAHHSSWLMEPYVATATWEDYAYRLESMGPLDAMIGAITAIHPHSAGTAEIIVSGGFAFVVIGVCLLASQPLRWLLLPVAALGSMPLTAYTAHLISIMVIASPGGTPFDPPLWGWTTLALLAGTTLVAVFAGQGPLERLTARVARAMAGRSH